MVLCFFFMLLDILQACLKDAYFYLTLMMKLLNSQVCITQNIPLMSLTVLTLPVPGLLYE